MRIALCNKTLEHLPLEAFFDLAAGAGYDAVELGPQTLGTSVTSPDPAARAGVRRAAQRRGLAIVGFNSIFQDTQDLALVTRDAAVRRRSTAMLSGLAQLVGEWGARVIVVGSPRQRQAPPDATSEEAIRLFLDELLPACDVAAEHGVTFCLEPLEARLTNFMNDTAEGIAIIERAQHPALRLLLDVKQMATEGPSMPDLIRQGAPWLRHFHLNDANRHAPGEGATDFVPILRALLETSYTGAASVEAFAFNGPPDDVLRRSRAYLAACLEGAAS